MQVIATAGHVDHGKSALVMALTGMEPDRWAEERRRGLTIDLGFAWMELPGGERLAFVDVPGHERFVPNMLAGVGPVPAVLVVVAADGGWMPQSAEHLAAIDAVGIRHGLLAVTRSDLADPGPATRQALDRIARSTWAPRSRAGERGDRRRAARTAGRAGAAGGVAARPRCRRAGPVVVDRSFSIRGSGTVVTGTLPAGTVALGQEILLTPSLRPARIRGLESMGEPVASVTGVARVAVNLRGVPADVPARGMALVDAGGWTMTRLIDVRLTLMPHLPLTPHPSRPSAGGCAGAPPVPPEMTLHIGSARTLARIRPLGPPDPAGTALARLTLREALPLHIGDRVLLRDPGSAAVMILGATVLDVAPPQLVKRGAAAAAGRELAAWPDLPKADDLLRRHGLLRTGALAAMGVTGYPPPVAAGGSLIRCGGLSLRRRLAEAVTAHAQRDPLAIGMPPEAARAALGLPDRALVEALARAPADPGSPVRVELNDGYLRMVTQQSPDQAQSTRRPQDSQRDQRSPEPQKSRQLQQAASLPAHVAAAVRAVLAEPRAGAVHGPGSRAAARAPGWTRERSRRPRGPGCCCGSTTRPCSRRARKQRRRPGSRDCRSRSPPPRPGRRWRPRGGSRFPCSSTWTGPGLLQRLPDDRRRLRLYRPAGPQGNATAGERASANVGRSGQVASHTAVSGGRTRRPRVRWRAGSRGAREQLAGFAPRLAAKPIQVPWQSRSARCLPGGPGRRASASCRGPGRGVLAAAAGPPGRG